MRTLGLLSIIVLIALFWSASPARVKPSEPAAASVRPVQLPAQSPRKTELPALKTAVASHPLVGYENPGSIRSFADPRLEEAYQVYFSLIGPAKEKFPFRESGFDTEVNALLAEKTLREIKYVANRKSAQSRTSLIALMHLANSELSTSKSRRLATAQEILERMGKSQGLPAKLHREDLKFLLQTSPPSDLEDIAKLYDATQDPDQRRAIALGVQGGFLHRGQQGEQGKAFMARVGMEF